MKYGRLCFSNESISDNVCNLGDIVQVFAIDRLYEQMNIPKEDIVDILLQDVAQYKGEKIFLPLNAYIKFNKKIPFLPMSEDIVPIFLSINCTEDICRKYRDYFKKYEPIGCRDEATYKSMKRNGISAFFLGCTTITFPRREYEPVNGKAYIIDLHPSALGYIPDKIKKNAVYYRQDVPLKGRPQTIDTAHEMERISRDRYRELYSKASLVLTSRLHVASPCIAMGVPVILIRKGYDDRFSWIDRYIPLYDTNQSIDINWTPQVEDFEEIKAKIQQAAISVLQREYDWTLLDEVSQYYLSRKKTKLRMSFVAQVYVWLCKYAPRLANFIRDKILFRFTISGSNTR